MGRSGVVWCDEKKRMSGCGSEKGLKSKVGDKSYFIYVKIARSERSGNAIFQEFTGFAELNTEGTTRILLSGQ